MIPLARPGEPRRSRCDDDDRFANGECLVYGIVGVGGLQDAAVGRASCLVSDWRRLIPGNQARPGDTEFVNRRCCCAVAIATVCFAAVGNRGGHFSLAGDERDGEQDKHRLQHHSSSTLGR